MGPEIGLAKWLVDLGKENAIIGMLAFSMVVNALLVIALRSIYNSHLKMQKDTLEAVGDAKNVIGQLNLLIQLLVARKNG